MKGQIIAILGVVSASVFYSCGSLDYGKEKPTEILVQADEPDANLAWEQDVSYIMQIKCANCHGPNHHKFAPEKAYTNFPFNFEDKDTFTKNASRIKNVIFNEEFRAQDPQKYAMPPNYSTPLTELEKTAIKNYIEKKLPVVATPVATPQGTPDPAAPSVKYADVKVYLEATCGGAGCHTGGVKSLFDASSQAGAAAKAARAAEKMVDAADPMPQSGRVDSTPDGKKLLDWFKAGAP